MLPCLVRCYSVSLIVVQLYILLFVQNIYLLSSTGRRTVEKLNTRALESDHLDSIMFLHQTGCDARQIN